MNILTCTPADITTILNLYNAARQLQTERGMVVWPSFDKAFLLAEINQNRHFKLVDNGVVACVWVITLQDEDIWEAREKDDALYIHRIATNPVMRGKRYIDGLVNWAKAYAVSLHRKYVRLDTLGNNTKLIQHYTSAGFTFLGIHTLQNTANLPGHYQKEPQCCLFQIAV